MEYGPYQGCAAGQAVGGMHGVPPGHAAGQTVKGVRKQGDRGLSRSDPGQGPWGRSVRDLLTVTTGRGAR